MALLLVTERWDRDTLVSAPQHPSPYPLNVTREAQWLL
jgi:hypothetical protein